MTEVVYISERQLDHAIAGRLDGLLGPGFGQFFLDELRITRALQRGLLATPVGEQSGPHHLDGGQRGPLRQEGR